MIDVSLINCFATFLLAAFCAGIVIPQILLIAFRKKLFDEPDERKIHHLAIPRLGGIAFQPLIFFSLILVLGLNETFGTADACNLTLDGFMPLAYTLCASILIYLVGIADDLIGVRYRAKFIIQILCAALLICGGTCLDNLHGMFMLHGLPQFVAWPLTALLLVYIINAINLIDGLDGLASSLSACACLIYGVAYLVQGDMVCAMLAFGTLGVLVPFFYYNVFGNPERHLKIFMGDTGSLTIGLLLSFLSIRMTSYETITDFPQYNVAVIALAPLLLPCMDVVRVFMRRLRRHKNPFMPDKTHIHHKLLMLGLSHHAAMITIIVASLLLTVMNVLLSACININLLLLLDIAVWVVANIVISRMCARRAAVLAE